MDKVEIKGSRVQGQIVVGREGTEAVKVREARKKTWVVAQGSLVVQVGVRDGEDRQKRVYSLARRREAQGLVQ